MKRRNKRKNSRRWSKWLSWSMKIIPILLVVDAAYVMKIWPEWDDYRHGPTPKSQFIKEYQQQNSTPLRWRPTTYQKMPKHLLRALIIAEDSNFYSHNGFDLEEMYLAIKDTIKKGKPLRGASTISQQLVKNHFFTADRSFMRKWHEAVFTLGLEYQLSKSRILMLYLNTVEFGFGIFGVEAAAQHYWGVSTSQLSIRQVSELTASLSAPKRDNPASRSERFLMLADLIEQRLYAALYK